MKIAYFDCPTGIAGDMCLGALIDAGVPFTYLQDSLAKLGITEEYTLKAETVERRGIAATKLQVILNVTNPPVRHLATIESLIRGAQLPAKVEEWSLAIFCKLAVAEAAVHNATPESVHFHEVGATDALVDIVGTCLGLEWLGVEALYCSALPTGGGTVRAAHGRLPVPVPAVLELWQMGEVPIYSNGIDRELVTPTGAAIVVTLAKEFGGCPPLRLKKVGLGAGNHDLPIPNVLRLWIGETSERETHDRHHHHHHHDHQHHHHSDPIDHHHHSHSVEGNREQGTGNRGQGIKSLSPSPLDSGSGNPAPTHNLKNSSPPETIVQLQTQIDDLNPQVIGYLFDRLLAEGALDVFTTAIGMKKSRPGILLTVICHLEQVMACETVIFRETTTLGIRRSVQERQILQRRLDAVNTPYGSVRVKVAWQTPVLSNPSLNGDAADLSNLGLVNVDLLNVQPEYEDCATIARTQQIPLIQVHQAALSSWHSQTSGVQTSG
jgi:uncharacterized protein (TIGR00299 family) protein